MKRSLAHVFHLGQRLGVDVLSRHFYSEIPDIAKLRRTREWRKPFGMLGVRGADLENQRAFARRTVEAIGAAAIPPTLHEAAGRRNGEPALRGYGLPAGLVRRLRPRVTDDGLTVKEGDDPASIYLVAGAPAVRT